MNSTAVNKGSFVSANTVIGYGGETGNSEGTHNHYDIYNKYSYTEDNNFFKNGRPCRQPGNY